VLSVVLEVVVLLVAVLALDPLVPLLGEEIQQGSS
jgi:hypothetical protein